MGVENVEKKGFAISGILYPLLVLFLCFILLILSNLAEGHYRLRTLTNDIMLQINGDARIDASEVGYETKYNSNIKTVEDALKELEGMMR